MRTLKLIFACAVAALTVSPLLAGPRGCPGGRPCHPCRPCPPPPPPPHPHHHHGCDNGAAVAAGIVGGAILGAAISQAATPSTTVVATPTTVVATPTVVTTPVVQQQTVVAQPVTQVQNVWVEGCYVNQAQADGSVVRVWQPAHYEQRTVTVR